MCVHGTACIHICMLYERKKKRRVNDLNLVIIRDHKSEGERKKGKSFTSAARIGEQILNFIICCVLRVILQIILTIATAQSLWEVFPKPPFSVSII